MNPNFNAFLTQLKLFLIVIGTLLAEQGLDHTTAYKWIMLASGSVIVIGNAGWALWSSYSNWRKAAAVGAQATLNMMASGKAVDQEGNFISKFSPDAVPPKPITVASATEIVKNFAPPAGSITKS